MSRALNPETPRPHMLLAFALVVAGCSPVADDGPVAVDVIGAMPAASEIGRAPLSPPAAIVTGAVRQGLVRFDAGGQIEPGLAVRWDVSNDGLYYIFRVEDGPVDAAVAARALNAAIRPRGGNPLAPVLGAIEEVTAVTPEVVEIRLRGPRPNMLQLLAQPDLAVTPRHDRDGAGPFRITRRTARTLLLSRVDQPDEALDEEARTRRMVRLRFGRAASAVAHFAAGDSGAVIGGRFNDLAVAQAAALQPRLLRFDPVSGMFGLAIVEARGFLGSVDTRRALSMALDRDALSAAFGVPWPGQASIVPGAQADLPRPATPDWIDNDMSGRRALARAIVARWTADQGAPPLLRVALPPGPGSRLLLALLRAQWGAIGVAVTAVPADASADLRLIDDVAPADIGSWYLRRLTCDRSAVCDAGADAALIAARDATTLPARSALLADADRRLTDIAAFIPLAPPLRWSIVSPALTQWRDNARGIHPLDQLRGVAR